MIIAPHVGFSTYYYSIDGGGRVKAFYGSQAERLVMLCFYAVSLDKLFS